jgi:hypothetical protein
MRISCSSIHALSVGLVGFIISMGLPLGPVLYWRSGGLGRSATMVGIGKLPVCCSGSGKLLPWKKVFCLLKKPGVAVASLSGEMASASSVIGLDTEDGPVPTGAEVGASAGGTIPAEVGVGVDCGYALDSSMPKFGS